MAYRNRDYRTENLAKLLVQLTFKRHEKIHQIIFDVCRKKFTAYVPDDSIATAVKDVLLNREYEYFPEFELCNFTGGHVIDCGSHVGLFSLVASVFSKKVIAIEPHPRNFRLLKLNLSANKISNVDPIGKAFYPYRTNLRLFEGQHSGAHSLIRFSGEFKEVETITLQEIVDCYGFIDLLKMDIEGAEFKVFKNLDTYALKHVKMIVAEVHLRYGDIHSIVNKLRSWGFSIKVISPPSWKRNFGYRIELHDMMKLKILQNILYTLLRGIRYQDKNLAILFAKRRG